MVYILKKEMNSSRVLWIAFEIIIMVRILTTLLEKGTFQRFFGLLRILTYPKGFYLKPFLIAKTQLSGSKEEPLRLLDLTFLLKGGGYIH